VYSDMLPTERITRATWILVQGHTVTVRGLAAELEITPSGARKMLERMSRVVPLVDDGGVWRLVGEEEGETGIEGE
jgi:Mn-dependent DtxR family transcriptional regulator